MNYKIIILTVLCCCFSATGFSQFSFSKKNLTSNVWKLQSEVDRSNVFNKDTLIFLSCNNCFADTSLAALPSLEFYKTFYSNIQGFKTYFDGKHFDFSFEIKLDSVERSIETKTSYTGKWKLRGSKKKKKIILEIKEGLIWKGETSVATHEKLKVVYIVVFPSRNKMIWIRER